MPQSKTARADVWRALELQIQLTKQKKKVAAGARRKLGLRKQRTQQEEQGLRMGTAKARTALPANTTKEQGLH